MTRILTDKQRDYFDNLRHSPSALAAHEELMRGVKSASIATHGRVVAVHIAIAYPNHPAMTLFLAGGDSRACLEAMFEVTTERNFIRSLSVPQEIRVNAAVDALKAHFAQQDVLATTLERAAERRVMLESLKPKPAGEVTAEASTVKRVAQQSRPAEKLANGLTFQQMRERAVYSGTAYTGWTIEQDHLPLPVVIDLKSMSIAADTDGRIPSLKDHDPSRVIGNSLAINTGQTIEMTDGRFTVNNPYSREILGSIAAGHTWQASVRGAFGRLIQYKKGQTVHVNNRTIHGPVLIAHEFKLREVTWTGLGANQPDKRYPNGASFHVEIKGQTS